MTDEQQERLKFLTALERLVTTEAREILDPVVQAAIETKDTEAAESLSREIKRICGLELGGFQDFRLRYAMNTWAES